MQTLKQRAIAFAGAIALGGAGTGFAAAADMPAQPYPPQYQQGAQEYYGPGSAEEAYPYAPPPVVYGYPPPPPPVYYNYAPPVVVGPGPYYPRRYRYAYGDRPYPRYFGPQAYAPRIARGYGYGYGGYGRHWHR